MTDTLSPTEVRRALRDRGYSPIPVEGKRPALKAWEHKTEASADEIILWENIYNLANNTGILTRLVPTIDIDILDEGAAEAVEYLAREWFEERGYFLVRIGEAPKRCILLRTDTPFPKQSRVLTAPNGAEYKIELLCDGQQVVVSGIHPKTGQPYSWHGGDPTEIPIEDLPYVAAQVATKFLDAAADLLINSFGYKKGVERPVAGANGGHPADWRWLIDSIESGKDLHDSTTALAAKLITSGMGEGAAVNFLRGVYEGSAAKTQRPKDWADRYKEISRAVESASKKFNKPADQDDRWQQEQRDKQQAPPPLPRILHMNDFVKDYIPPDYLIDGVIQRRFIYAATGITGHAKTAVALLLAQLVACANNASLGFHKAQKGRVIYFVGENPDDVRMRVIGSNALRTDDCTQDNLWFIPGVFNITEMMATLTADTKENGEVSLIIVDTSAAYFLQQDENSNPQMGAHARVMRSLTTLPGGPAVLVLCHPIKHAQEPAQLYPRGGGAFLAEMDGNLTLWRKNEEIAELSYNKMRGPGFQPMSFKIVSFTTPKLVDANGRMITTVHAVLISNQEEDQAADRSNTNEDKVLCAMLRLPADQGGSMSKWAEYLKWQTGRGEPDKLTVQRAIERLAKESKRLIVKKRDRWVLTDAGLEAAREAALRLFPGGQNDDTEPVS